LFSNIRSTIQVIDLNEYFSGAGKAGVVFAPTYGERG
jgi:hypothetical protein